MSPSSCISHCCLASRTGWLNRVTAVNLQLSLNIGGAVASPDVLPNKVIGENEVSEEVQ